MANNTQMLKGILEGCILKIIKKNKTYGYEIVEKLMDYGFDDISESSVYPILIRLEKKGHLDSTMEKSPFGPMRKYYYITDKGAMELDSFISSWQEIKRNVERVLEG